MPRARTASSEEEAVVVAPKKRAPRKRVPRIEEAVEESQLAPKPRVRRPRATPKVNEEVAEVAEPVRRAPTPIQAERRAVKRGNRALVIVAIFFVLVTGSGVAIGMTDAGPIDVVAVVNERNERVGRGEVREGENSVTVPVQNTTAGANGGMVPADPSLVPTPPPPSTESATSTDETASSTEEVDTEAIDESTTNDGNTDGEPATTEAAPAAEA